MLILPRPPIVAPVIALLVAALTLPSCRNLVGARTAFERALEENRDEPLLHQRLGPVRKQLLETAHDC